MAQTGNEVGFSKETSKGKHETPCVASKILIHLNESEGNPNYLAFEEF
jgi:hypothetical protein